jgi:rubrerythrin
MDAKFSASDIVEIAIEIEKNGRSFYENFAKKTRIKNVADFFRDMAQEETQHEKDFQVILSSVMQHKPCDIYPQEYLAYINAIAGGYLFKDNDDFRERASRIDSENAAIDFSLGMEKDSILLYEEMKKIVSDADKALIEAIIDQEREHVKRLWAIRSPKR